MKKFFDYLNKVELIICMFSVVGFTSVLMLGAVVRVAGHPLNWCNDTALLLLAWTTFLGGDVAFRAGRLVNVDLIISRFPKVLKKIVVVIVYAVLIAIIATMIYQGFKLCINVGKRTLEGIPFMSYRWVAASIPVGFSFMLLTALYRFKQLMTVTDDTEISKM